MLPNRRNLTEILKKNLNVREKHSVQKYFVTKSTQNSRTKTFFFFFLKSEKNLGDEKLQRLADVFQGRLPILLE